MPDEEEESPLEWLRSALMDWEESRRVVVCRPEFEAGVRALAVASELEDCAHLSNEGRLNEAQDRYELVCVQCGEVHCWATREFLTMTSMGWEVWRARVEDARHRLEVRAALASTAADCG